MTRQESFKRLVRTRMEKTAESCEGATERPHRVIARWVARQGVEPLAWNAQAVAGSYERARGLRAVGEHSDGFRVTVTAPVTRLYDAFLDESMRERWLPDGQLSERTATRPKSRALPGGTGRPGSTSRSWPRAGPGASWPWSMRGSPTPRRRRA